MVLRLLSLILLLHLNTFGYDWTQDGDAIGTWLMDVTGSPTLDATASYDGTVAGATFSTADNPAAYSVGYYSFDGTNDSLNMGDIVEADDSTTSLSGVAWVWQNNVTQDHWIFGSYDGTSGIFWQFDDTSAASSRTDVYRLFVRESAGAGQGLVNIETPSSGASEDVWEHVAWSWTASDGSGLRLWLDGVEVADSPVSTSGNENCGQTSGDWIAGEYPATGGLDRAGRIDELGLFLTVLDGTDINDIMDNGLLQAAAASFTPKVMQF